MVRRAERGIGLTIRSGQAAGEIRTENNARGMAPNHGVRNPNPMNQRSPTEWLKRGDQMTETYDLTDGVTDEEFDEAIAAARKDGNVSRELGGVPG